MGNAMWFEGLGRKARLLATTRRAFLLSLGGGVLLSSENIFFRPRCTMRNIGLEIREKGYPAGACSAIGLSFRALAGIVSKFRSTNGEMIHKRLTAESAAS